MVLAALVEGKAESVYLGLQTLAQVYQAFTEACCRALLFSQLRTDALPVSRREH